MHGLAAYQLLLRSTRKIRTPGAMLKQVTFNAKAWRTSHPVRRDDPSAPDLLHWAFPRVHITRHNLEIMWESGRGRLYARQRASLAVCKDQFAALRCC
jgi:hypothetical protein